MGEVVEGLLSEKASILKGVLELASRADFSLGVDEDSSRAACDGFVGYWASRDLLFERMREIDLRLAGLGVDAAADKEIAELAARIAELDRSLEGQTRELRSFVARGIKEVRDARLVRQYTRDEEFE